MGLWLPQNWRIISGRRRQKGRGKQKFGKKKNNI